MAIEDALAKWLGNQRWFAGKGQGLRDLAIVADTELVSGDPELRHLIVAVSHGTAVDYYQVPVGLRRRLPARLKHARIGTVGGGPAGGGRIAYDALHDADLTKPLLAGIAAGAEIGSIRMRAIPGARFDTGLDSLVLGSEQSNTSLVYGDESILKVFRRLSPGPNPDLEVTTALARLGSPQVAEPLGWMETRLEGAPTSLAILSRYLRLATDGWTLAATSVRDLYAAVGDASDRDENDRTADGTPASEVRAADVGGDFAGEARRLGIATAQVHADLAVAFGTDELGTDAVGELTERMYRKLDLAVAAVPELAKHVDMISDAFSELAKLSGPFPVQRVHGDYHLGQVLRTETGWVVLDFEGEPATPLAQRRARSSPLRDVAGLLRSFDYAARHQLIVHPGQAALSDAARDWVRRNASAFCVGYAEAGGVDPVANQVLLRALQLDKAVYEVLYEARHRPSWLPIPLDSLAEF
ncbi:MAG: maltokinase [Trebonia sp.]|jgi:maltokinase|nr:putative pep2 protein [Actinomycetes bacterium]MDX6344680.1 maltokinase [Trebonia sp.]MDX6415440.1 maltokinase [Trebonia sp.]